MEECQVLTSKFYEQLLYRNKGPFPKSNKPDLSKHKGDTEVRQLAQDLRTEISELEGNRFFA